MNISELIGCDLDFWVAKAEGHILKRHYFHDDWLEVETNDFAAWSLGYIIPNNVCHSTYEDYDHYRVYSPSTDWSIAGPIIERNHIQLKGDHNQWRIPTWKWMAWPDSLGAELGPKTHGRGGDTALIAAMRVYVASKFGEVVSVDGD